MDKIHIGATLPSSDPTGLNVNVVVLNFMSRSQSGPRDDRIAINPDWDNAKKDDKIFPRGLASIRVTLWQINYTKLNYFI